MNTGADPIFGLHAKALTLWTQRNEVLAANIANADTPGYKARDVDFASTLGKAQERTIAMKTTHMSHMNSSSSGAGGGSAELLYRVPMQPSLDGNTVETDVEQAKFGENALRYQASLRFVSGSVRTMKAAIAGRHQ